MALYSLYFAPLTPFVSHPDRIAVVGAAFMVTAIYVGMAHRRLSWPSIAAGLCWLLFAAWERYCVVQGYDIRVDLVLIWPVLLSVTLWGVLGPLLRKRSEPVDQKPN